jgi:hypothetical protein
MNKIQILTKSLFPSIWMTLLFLSCSSTPAYEKAVDPLDGGRSFIENCMQGDIKKAHFYMISDSSNEAYFKQISDAYFALDKEGRMQNRQASLQINELVALDPKTTLIYYKYSYDETPKVIKVVETPEGWKVDLKYSYEAGLKK